MKVEYACKRTGDIMSAEIVIDGEVDGGVDWKLPWERPDLEMWHSALAFRAKELGIEPISMGELTRLSREAEFA